MDIPGKITGSTLTAAEFNQITDELQGWIASTGQALSDSNVTQVALSSSDYVAGADFYIDTGGVDNYVLSAVSMLKTPTVYLTGMRIRFIPSTTSSGGAAVINVATLGVKSIKMTDGSTDPVPGMVQQNVPIDFVYNGTVFIPMQKSTELFSNIAAGNATVNGTLTYGSTSDAVFGGSTLQNLLDGVSSPITAWVNFDGDGIAVIRDSFNVSSVDFLGTGNYRINFTSALANANYVFVGMCGGPDGVNNIVGAVAQLTTSIEIMTTDNAGGGGRDTEIVCVTIVGG